MIARWKQVVLSAVLAVALVGVFVAITNMPVITGCGYYARCDVSTVAD